MKGEGYHHRKTNRTVSRLYGLTMRQLKVLHYALKGMTSKRSAVLLGISYKTVDKHLETAYRALNSHNKQEAGLALMNLVIGNECRKLAETDGYFLPASALRKIKYIFGEEDNAEECFNPVGGAGGQAYRNPPELPGIIG